MNLLQKHPFILLTFPTNLKQTSIFAFLVSDLLLYRIFRDKRKFYHSLAYESNKKLIKPVSLSEAPHRSIFIYRRQIMRSEEKLYFGLKVQWGDTLEKKGTPRLWCKLSHSFCIISGIVQP